MYATSEVSKDFGSLHFIRGAEFFVDRDLRVAQRFEKLARRLEIAHREFDLVAREHAIDTLPFALVRQADILRAAQAQDAAPGAQASIRQVEANVALEDARLDQRRAEFQQARFQPLEIVHVKLDFDFLSVHYFRLVCRPLTYGISSMDNSDRNAWAVVRAETL